jgi:hypothetical protein
VANGASQETDERIPHSLHMPIRQNHLERVSYYRSSLTLE